MNTVTDAAKSRRGRMLGALRYAVLDVLIWSAGAFAAIWGFGRYMGWN